MISFWNFLVIIHGFLVIFGWVWQCHASIFLEIYRQKLKQSVSNGELSDEDVKSLERTQIMLCIPKQTVESAHADICGSLFEKVTISLPCTLFFGKFPLSTMNLNIFLCNHWNIGYKLITWDFKIIFTRHDFPTRTRLLVVCHSLRVVLNLICS